MTLSIAERLCSIDLDKLNVSIEDGLNDTHRGRWKYLEKDMSQCHFIHQKSHMERESGPPR
jgi:hypothetical protein